MKKMIIMLVVALVACGSPASPTISPEVKATAAEASYEAQLVACVDKYPAGDPRVDVCADGVRASWHRGPQDGGK